MSDFKAKMHHIVCRLPQAPSWILGAYFEGEGKGRERKGGEERVEKDRKGERGGAGSAPQAKA